jgi:hypothetical protein
MSDSLKSFYPDTTGANPMTPKDFYELSGPDLLAYCGVDASKWAEAFCKIKEAQGWAAADIDEGLMIGWFANAIEHSAQVRSVGVAQAPNRNELTQIICDALWGPRPIELRNDMVAKAGSRAADAVLNRFAGVANDAAESPRDHLSEMAFEVWRKSLKSQSRFSNEQLFTDGYVAGWNDASAHSPDPAQSAVKQIELEEIARRAVHEYPVASGLYVDADSKAGYGALRDLRLFLGIEPAGHATSVVPSTTCPKPCPQLAQGESWCVWPKCSCSVPSTHGASE